MNYGMNTSTSFWGVPPPDKQTVCTSQWLHPQEEWKVLNIVTSTRKPYRAMNQPGVHASRVINKNPPTKAAGNPSAEPIWKRRGAKPIPSLRLLPVIRGDITLTERICEDDESLEIVDDIEWCALQPNYFEVHSLTDVHDGVVIDPPTYPVWFNVPSLSSPVPALLPSDSSLLLNNALKEGYSIDTLIKSMGNVICSYGAGLIPLKRRPYQEVLILARKNSWQGAAALTAAKLMLQNWLRVSVFILQEWGRDNNLQTKEEREFMAAGGTVYKSLEALRGQKFRVVVVALEDQYSGRKSNLSMYGDFLQHSVAIFVDPPILKCSYTTALQIATRGCYNMCQKTLILTPFLPKPFMADDFVELVVVDGGITLHTQKSSGITHTMFPRSNGPNCEVAAPIPFKVKGSKLYFYRDGKRVPC